MSNSKNLFSENFTIYDSPSDEALNLHSAWHVCRNTSHYASSRDYVDENLYCLVYTVSGNATLYTKTKSMELKPNTITLLKHCEIDKYFPTTETWEYFWFNFYGIKHVPYFTVNEVNQLSSVYPYQNTMEEIFSLMKSYNPLHILLTRTLFCELVYRWAKELKEHSIQYLPNSEDVYEMISYLCQHLEENMTVSDMAKKCHLSEKQFRMIFHRITDEPPKKFLCRLRLQKVAEALVKTNKSISELAYEMNFSSPFQLSRDFKKMFGDPPKSFREKNRK